MVLDFSSKRFESKEIDGFMDNELSHGYDAVKVKYKMKD